MSILALPSNEVRKNMLNKIHQYLFRCRSYFRPPMNRNVLVPVVVMLVMTHKYVYALKNISMLGKFSTGFYVRNSYDARTYRKCCNFCVESILSEALVP